MTNQTLYFAIYFLVVLFSFMRIAKWSRERIGNGDRMQLLKGNLIGFALYTAIFLLPALFYHEAPSNSSDTLFLPGFGNFMMVVFWLFIFNVHLLFFWFHTEVDRWMYRIEKRRNHIQ